jgi:hypothetical protein
MKEETEKQNTFNILHRRMERMQKQLHDAVICKRKKGFWNLKGRQKYKQVQ